METVLERVVEVPKPALSDLVTLDEYQQQNERIFPSLESLRWFIRRSRDDLETSGALRPINGRLWVYPAAFEACVLRNGQARRSA